MSGAAASAPLPETRASSKPALISPGADDLSLARLAFVSGAAAGAGSAPGLPFASANTLPAGRKLARTRATERSLHPPCPRITFEPSAYHKRGALDQFDPS